MRVQLTRGFTICVTAIAVMLVANPAAYGVGWFDDFNDGDAEDDSPLTWTYNELVATPGIYDASSGDYSLSKPDGDPLADLDTLVASVDANFEDTYVRTQAVIVPGANPEDDGGNVGVVFRFDPSSFSGYGAVVDAGAGLYVFRGDGGVTTEFSDGMDVGLSASNDIVLEVNMVLDQIDVFVWDPADEKPDFPTATFIDPDYGDYTSGRAGIIYVEDDDNTTGLFRWAGAQDTPFPPVFPPLPGDFDKDGDVDGVDFLAWQGGFGLTTGATQAQGDSNGDGAVDGADFLIWQANFPSPGSGSGAGGGSVPEPTSAALAALGLLAVAATRRHSSR